MSVSKRRAKVCSGSFTSLRPPPNNRLKLAARGRPEAEWEAEHARRSLAGPLG